MNRNAILPCFAVGCLALAGCTQTTVQTRSGQSTIVEQLIAWKPNCSYPGKPSVQLFGVSHGVVSLREGKSVIPNVPAAGKCAGRTIRATHVIYTPPIDYHGTVDITFKVTPTTVNKTFTETRRVKVQ